jgi:hypothetical protein
LIGLTNHIMIIDLSLPLLYWMEDRKHTSAGDASRPFLLFSFERT